jgi:hypothetical protein
MRNELFTRVVEFIKSKTHHRYCEDGFYACPKNEEYFGLYSGIPIEQRQCNCDADEAVQLLKDLEQPL